MPERVGEDERVPPSLLFSDHPIVIRPPMPAGEQAPGEWLEPILEKRARISGRIRDTPLPRHATMEKVGVRGVNGVLLRLHPVAAERRPGRQLAASILTHKHVPAWQKRCWLWPHVGKEEPCELLERIGTLSNGLTERGALRLKGLLKTPATRIIEPSMIGTPDTLLLNKTVVKRCAAMGAMFVQQSIATLGITIDH
jgi:hypothetical protein